jgi:glyoxylase-like metal-dependent hydrolase (beta-lactamase superfamily II)
MGVWIEHVLETHNHADHVSGHGRLAAATGANIHIHRLARPDLEHNRSTTAGSSNSKPSPSGAAHARASS